MYLFWCRGCLLFELNRQRKTNYGIYAFPIFCWQYNVAHADHGMMACTEMLHHFHIVYWALPGWEVELDKYNDSFIVNRTNEELDGQIIPLLAHIAYHPGW